MRVKSDKLSGGQWDHPGRNLEWSAEVDHVVTHPVTQCSVCGASLEFEPLEDWLLYQVYDLPTLELEVTEHQVDVQCYPHCGEVSQGEFSSKATNVVQYGPRLKEVMLYLMEAQLLPSH